MLNQFNVTLYYKNSRLSLLSIILGVCLVINYQSIALGKVFNTQSKTTNFVGNSNTLKNLFSRQQILKYPILAELLPPSTREQEPIFNPIEPNPFPNLRYVVYIESENPLLLGIIRQKIEPRAVLRAFGDQKVIQVGSFSELFFALDLIDYLEEKGINGELARRNPGQAFGEPVKSTPTLAASVYPPVLHPIAYGFSNIESYYVLIPSKSKDLSLITYKLRLLGIPDRGIQVTEIPENVAIGPFVEKERAEKWQRYLLDSGFENVVIYFGR
ncbi:MAG: hypothetical protein QNJ68_22625 [Microcoleaceae cyanobacterium MO_207.B10]|nr:hypothetical protein [Microcoleaceae cyanobacterium MO_207.B10]